MDNKELDQFKEELKDKFKDLSEESKKLLVYRLIKDIKLNSTIESDKKTDIIYSIIEVSDCGMFKGLLMYTTADNDIEYRNIYSESLIKYNQVLNNYKKLAQELNINSSLELSHLFSYLLWNGYFSVTKTHDYKLQGRLLLPTMHSFDVIRGQGVCLAYSELLHNYLTICDKKAALLDCYVPTKKNSISFSYRPEIERSVKNSAASILLTTTVGMVFINLIKKIGNHAITLIEELDKLYIYDATNFYVLNIEEGLKASIINGKGTFDLKPINTFLFTPKSDPNYLFEKLVTYNNGPCFSRQDIIFSFEEIVELLNKNISLLDDAYDNIHSELEFINNQTNEFGGHFKVFRRIQKRK